MSSPVRASEIRRELGVGLIYARKLDSLLDGSHPQVAVIELEPQTLWEKVSNRDKWYYRPNEAAIDRVAAYPLAKLMQVLDYGKALRRPVAFETGVNYLRPRGDEMTDADFWGAVAEGADSGILLDLHNLWCNELNGRWRVRDVIDRFPLERVWEVHLAGGMPMDGYWLDAHSGRVPEPLIDIAAQVIPRLPNLGALMFELLPEHFDTVGIDGVSEQVDQLSELWRLRSPALARSGSTTSDVGEPTAEDLDAVRAWETTLYDVIVGSAPPGPQYPELEIDPGVPVYRELVMDFRRGHLAQAMHYTMTLLLIGLGRQDTSELLDTYFSQWPAQMYRALEVESFARFLTQRSELLDRVRYLREVLGYEHALIRATVLGEDS